MQRRKIVDPNSDEENRGIAAEIQCRSKEKVEFDHNTDEAMLKKAVDKGVLYVMFLNEEGKQCNLHILHGKSVRYSNMSCDDAIAQIVVNYKISVIGRTE